MPGMADPSIVAATSVAVVWIVAGLVTTGVFIVMLVALVRHVLLIGRAVGQFNDEAAPILREMSEQSAAASSERRGLQGGGTTRGGGRR
jgi:hypothetical protein